MIISAITDPQYLALNAQDTAFSGGSVPSDPGYHAPRSQWDVFPMGAASAADPEYLAGVESSCVEPYGFTEITFIEPPPPPPIPVPPTIAPIAPAGGATGVARDTSISFTIRDANVIDQVRRTSIFAWVEGDLIYNGLTNVFAADWEASTIVDNPFNGYDLDLIPDLFARFDVGQIITVRVRAQDLLGALTEESWTFTITTEQAFRLRIYDMLLGSVRKQDN